jgi:hypothetical protein
MTTKKKKRKKRCIKRWTQNRLISRKLGMATLVIFIIVISDLSGHALMEHTTYVLRDLVVAYLAVQGIVDYRTTKNDLQFKKYAYTEASTTSEFMGDI